MQKLNVDDPQVFNKWRARYWEMTNEEHKEFMEDAARKWGDQVHFTTQRFDNLFSGMQNHNGLQVLEIGGWKGELAKYCLSKFQLASWHNIEACRTAINETVDMAGLPYSSECPDHFDWFVGLRHRNYDVCVSSNTIEHLADEHLLLLLKYINGIKTILFEAPLQHEGQTWHNDWSTHILEMGWYKIAEVMRDYGYSCREIGASAWIYTK